MGQTAPGSGAVSGLLGFDPPYAGLIGGSDPRRGRDRQTVKNRRVSSAQRCTASQVFSQQILMSKRLRGCPRIGRHDVTVAD